MSSEQENLDESIEFEKLSLTNQIRENYQDPSIDAMKIENISSCNVNFKIPENQRYDNSRSPSPYPHRVEVDYDRLEADLIKEVEADELYWTRNAAKLRAVNQHGTYEEFRQIVLGAHLKPLKKEETDALRHDSLKGQVIWNVIAKGEKNEDGRKAENGQPEVVAGSAELFELPKTMREFSKIWKNSCGDFEAKSKYLKYLYDHDLQKLKVGRVPTIHENGRGDGNSSFSLRSIFAEEVPPEIFPQILQTLLTVLDDSDSDSESQLIEFVLEILQVLALSKKFHLTRAFLSRNDIETLKKLFQKLDEPMNNFKEQSDIQEQKPADLLDTLKSKYNLN